MTTGIVLSGGSSHGDFEVGALVALYNRGIRPDIVAGASVGSINGVAIAQGEDGLARLQSIWFSLKVDSDMWLEDANLASASRQVKSYLALSAGHLMVDLTQKMGPALPLAPIGDMILWGIQIGEIYDLVKKLLPTKSIYNLNPIRALLSNPNNLDPNKVANSGIKLRLAMVSLESGKLRFVDEHARFIDDNTQVSLVDAVMASAAIPAIFPPVKLGTENFIDGGVRDILPVQAALDAGADFVYAICCGKANVDPDSSYDNKNIIDIGLRAAKVIMPAQTQLSGTNPPRGWGADVRIIQSEVDVHDSMSIDPGLIRIGYDYGYMRAADMVDAYPGEDPFLLLRFLALSSLARQITEKRCVIWDAEFQANGEKRLTDIVRNDPLMPVPDPGALRTVRALKLELKALVEQRQTDFGLGPRATVQTTKLDFGKVAVPQSASLALQVRNSGDGGMPAGVSNLWTQWEAHNFDPMTPTPWDLFVSVAGTVPAATPPLGTVSLADLFLTSWSSSNPEFTVNVSATSLAPGQSATVTVGFKATAAGVQNSTLQIATNDANNPTLTIAIAAEAVIVPPTIAIAPVNLSFGQASLEQTVQRSLMISNRGSSPLTIQSLTFAPIPSPFSAPGQTFPFSIPALGVHALQLQFKPTHFGTYNETLTIHSDDPAHAQIAAHLTGTCIL